MKKLSLTKELNLIGGGKGYSAGGYCHLWATVTGVGGVSYYCMSGSY